MMNIGIALLFVVLTIGTAVGQVTPAMKEEFIRMHNDFRQRIQSCRVPGQPGANFMPNLEWNDQLAAKAQAFANQCQYGHEKASQRKIPAYDYVGQNWAIAKTIAQGLTRWFDQHKDYKFDSHTCDGGCGQYVRVVWANTKEIGCGVRDCGTGGSFRNGLWIICNYGPAPQFLVSRPYEKKAC